MVGGTHESSGSLNALVVLDRLQIPQFLSTSFLRTSNPGIYVMIIYLSIYLFFYLFIYIERVNAVINPHVLINAHPLPRKTDSVDKHSF